MWQTQQEHLQAEMALLLAPETAEHIRIHAARRLGRQGPIILPLFLSTLNRHPEITEPTWPWWPSQYTHCGHLLHHLCQQANLTLEALLQSPALTEPIGPMLWTCIIEAATLQPYSDPEELLIRGLETSWPTVRYAAVTALANLTCTRLLHSTTLTTLHAHSGPHEESPIRLTAACALLRSGEVAGLDILLQLTLAPITVAPIQEGYALQETRKAALFILSTETPSYISAIQREQLQARLIDMLHDNDPALALQAALVLSKIASPTLLPILSNRLANQKLQTPISILIVLEELAKRKTMRQLMRNLALPARVLPLLSAESAELRRQASYTLAACGGEYVAAALGAIVFNKRHPGHLEAIEALRQLHGVMHAPLRNNVIRWLLSTVLHPCEDTQLTALNTLTHLLWQARAQKQKQIWRHISQTIIHNTATTQLLTDPSPHVRQRTLELITILKY